MRRERGRGRGRGREREREMETVGDWRDSETLENRFRYTTNCPHRVHFEQQIKKINSCVHLIFRALAVLRAFFFNNGTGKTNIGKLKKGLKLKLRIEI